MEVYGFGLLGICMFIGFFLGNLLGAALGLSGDVGGVGFSMVLMIAYCALLEKKGKKLHPETEKGIATISSLYIPVVVAMSMNQNVYAAVTNGFVPIAAGALATFGSLLLVPVISKLGDSNKEGK